MDQSVYKYTHASCLYSLEREGNPKKNHAGGSDVSRNVGKGREGGREATLLLRRGGLSSQHPTTKYRILDERKNEMEGGREGGRE